MPATAMGSMKPETHKTPDIERDLVSACSCVPKALVWQQQILHMGKGKRRDADIDQELRISHIVRVPLYRWQCQKSHMQGRAEQGKAAEGKEEEACLQEQTSSYLYACMQGY
ncbi:hypothetical protein HYE67_008632 [Fusarium culmorum]|uniref:Uncharacterized protein n=1 Tax=Fusarium culmorum TaxID=5516 RepID=A0A7S8HYK3_FUSCU|nr:hypothetical protein HYE67_008632 [Fusarium culmorum]